MNRVVRKRRSGCYDSWYDFRYYRTLCEGLMKGVSKTRRAQGLSEIKRSSKMRRGDTWNRSSRDACEFFVYYLFKPWSTAGLCGVGKCIYITAIAWV